MADALPPGFQLEETSQTPGLQANDVPKGFQLTEEKYGTPAQKGITALEGAARGVVGPAAPYIEKHILGQKSYDIRGRQEENPILSGGSEALGLGAGLMTGTGEGALIGKAGEAAEALSGLSHVSEAEKLAQMAKSVTGPGAEELATKAADAAKNVSFGHKVGSAAVRNAAEFAVMQGSDDTSKMILNDPNTSAQTAIANTGLAAALGGGIGAIGAGVISPLWKATAGPKVEALLNGLKDHLNGATGAPLSDEVAKGLETLGVTPEAATKAGLSTNPTAREIHGTLQRAEKPEIINGIEKLHSDVSNAVANSLGVTSEEVMQYDKAAHGRNLQETFEKEYNSQYEPIAEQLDKRDAAAAKMPISDQARLDQYGKVLENGLGKVSANSPYYKLYHEYGERLLDAETVGDVDKITSEIGKRVRGTQDYNDKDALNHIRDMFDDFKENQIAHNTSGAEGVLNGAENAADILNQRADASRQYKEFAQMSNELASNLGVGKFRGAGTLKSKLANEITPELLLKKFSIKNNAEFVPFLQKYFPDTLQSILKNERLELVKPAILDAAKKGENPINIKKLADIIDKQMSGNKSYIESILPKEALDKISAAKSVVNALPSVKDSGTPAGLAKLFAHMPSSALAMVGMLMGHSPLVGGILGEAAQRLGKDAPEGIKLGYLKYLASDQPVKAEGFKAMVDYMHAAYKGDNALRKSIKGVLQPGMQVLADSQMPNAKQLLKLDKMVAQSQEKPDQMMQAQGANHVGHYLPDHQAALTQNSVQAVTYLQTLKPKPYQPSPLDRPIEPTKAEETRYQSALEIAQSPSVVLDKVKNGTIQMSDMQDIKAMYPDLYTKMSQQLSNQMISRHANDEPIPYKTKLGISLFIGQALDSSMQPANIMAAQPLPPQPIGGQSQGKSQPKGSPSKVSGKSAKSYQTPNQAAESDRASRAD